MIPTSERFDQLPPSGHRRGGKALTDRGVAEAPNGNYSAGLSSSAIGAERVRQHAGRCSFDRGLRELSTLTRLSEEVYIRTGVSVGRRDQTGCEGGGRG